MQLATNVIYTFFFVYFKMCRARAKNGFVPIKIMCKLHVTWPISGDVIFRWHSVMANKYILYKRSYRWMWQWYRKKFLCTFDWNVVEHCVCMKPEQFLKSGTDCFKVRILILNISLKVWTSVFCEKLQI